MCEYKYTDIEPKPITYPRILIAYQDKPLATQLLSSILRPTSHANCQQWLVINKPRHLPRHLPNVLLVSSLYSLSATVKVFMLGMSYWQHL